MACGCRGNRKNTRRVVTPASRATRPAENNTRQIRALERNKIERTDATGMTKQQRDEERKRRIQLIIAKRSGQ